MTPSTFSVGQVVRSISHSGEDRDPPSHPGFKILFIDEKGKESQEEDSFESFIETLKFSESLKLLNEYTSLIFLKTPTIIIVQCLCGCKSVSALTPKDICPETPSLLQKRNACRN